MWKTAAWYIRVSTTCHNGTSYNGRLRRWPQRKLGTLTLTWNQVARSDIEESANEAIEIITGTCIQQPKAVAQLTNKRIEKFIQSLHWIFWFPEAL